MTGIVYHRDIRPSTCDPETFVNSLYRVLIASRPYLLGVTAKHCDDLMACLEYMGATREFDEE